MRAKHAGLRAALAAAVVLMTLIVPGMSDVMETHLAASPTQNAAAKSSISAKKDESLSLLKLNNPSIFELTEEVIDANGVRQGLRFGGTKHNLQKIKNAQRAQIVITPDGESPIDGFSKVLIDIKGFGVYWHVVKKGRGLVYDNPEGTGQAIGIALRGAESDGNDKREKIFIELPRIAVPNDVEIESLEVLTGTNATGNERNVQMEAVELRFEPGRKLPNVEKPEQRSSPLPRPTLMDTIMSAPDARAGRLVYPGTYSAEQAAMLGNIGGDTIHWDFYTPVQAWAVLTSEIERDVIIAVDGKPFRYRLVRGRNFAFISSPYGGRIFLANGWQGYGQWLSPGIPMPGGRFRYGEVTFDNLASVLPKDQPKNIFSQPQPAAPTRREKRKIGPPLLLEEAAVVVASFKPEKFDQPGTTTRLLVPADHRVINANTIARLRVTGPLQNARTLRLRVTGTRRSVTFTRQGNDWRVTHLDNKPIKTKEVGQFQVEGTEDGLEIVFPSVKIKAQAPTSYQLEATPNDPAKGAVPVGGTIEMFRDGPQASLDPLKTLKGIPSSRGLLYGVTGLMVAASWGFNAQTWGDVGRFLIFSIPLIAGLGGIGVAGWMVVRKAESYRRNLEVEWKKQRETRPNTRLDAEALKNEVEYARGRLPVATDPEPSLKDVEELIRVQSQTLNLIQFVRVRPPLSSSDRSKHYAENLALGLALFPRVFSGKSFKSGDQPFRHSPQIKNGTPFLAFVGNVDGHYDLTDAYYQAEQVLRLNQERDARFWRRWFTRPASLSIVLPAELEDVPDGDLAFSLKRLESRGSGRIRHTYLLPDIHSYEELAAHIALRHDDARVRHLWQRVSVGDTNIGTQICQSGTPQHPLTASPNLLALFLILHRISKDRRLWINMEIVRMAAQMA